MPKSGFSLEFAGLQNKRSIKRLQIAEWVWISALQIAICKGGENSRRGGEARFYWGIAMSKVPARP